MKMAAERNPDVSRPGVVGLGQVASFDPGVQPRPDTLEGAVAQASGQPQGQALPVEPLNKMVEALVAEVSFLYTIGGNYHKPACHSDELPSEPYVSLLLDADFRKDGSSVSFTVSSSATGQSILDAMVAAYGKDVLVSDIAEGLGIGQADLHSPMSVERLYACFPELTALEPLLRVAFAFNDNPYLMLYTAPSWSRPLLAGAMQLAEAKGGFRIELNGIGNEATLRSASRALSAGNILGYARQVGVKDVKRYLEAASQLKVHS